MRDKASAFALMVPHVYGPACPEKDQQFARHLVMLRDLLQTYALDPLRLYLASHHYRRVQQHDLDALERAEQLVHTLLEAVTV